MKCGQMKCEATATHRYNWLGQEQVACELHAQKAAAVGRALGLVIIPGPLPPELADTEPPKAG